jgi:hypothetical protein
MMFLDSAKFGCIYLRLYCVQRVDSITAVLQCGVIDKERLVEMSLVPADALWS